MTARLPISVDLNQTGSGNSSSGFRLHPVQATSVLDRAEYVGLQNQIFGEQSQEMISVFRLHACSLALASGTHVYPEPVHYYVKSLV